MQLGGMKMEPRGALTEKEQILRSLNTAKTVFLKKENTLVLQR